MACQSGVQKVKDPTQGAFCRAHCPCLVDLFDKDWLTHNIEGKLIFKNDLDNISI